MNLQIKSFRPFIGAKDYAVSRAFYTELGFQETVISDGMSVFRRGEHCFYLQNYYAKEWIENTMLFFEVPDVQQCYAELKALTLAEKYPGAKLVPIKKDTWGDECFVLDPAGVLLHFGQFK